MALKGSHTQTAGGCVSHVCFSCRYANSSQQAIAARAEQQGLLIEGFNASRLAREQAKLPNAGKGLLNEQVNILNLPMPDFDVSGNPRYHLFASQAGSVNVPIVPGDSPLGPSKMLRAMKKRSSGVCQP